MTTRLTGIRNSARALFHRKHTGKIMEYVLIAAIAIAVLALVLLALLKVLIPAV